MKQFHLLFLTLILGIWVNQTESMAQYSMSIPSERAAYIAKQEAACSQAPLIFEGYPIKTSVKDKMLNKDPYKEPFRGETRILFVVNHVYRGELANDTIELYFYSGGFQYAPYDEAYRGHFDNLYENHLFLTDSLSYRDRGFGFFDLDRPDRNYKRYLFFGLPSKQKTGSGFPVVESFDKTSYCSFDIIDGNNSFGGIVNQELATEQFNYKGCDYRWLLHKKLSMYPNIKLPTPLNKETQELKKKPLTEERDLKNIVFAKSASAPSIVIDAVNQRFEMLNADLYMVFELQAKATSSTPVIDLNYLDWLTVGFQYNTSSFGSSIANTTSLILELGDGIPTANQSAYEFANQQNISSNQLKFDIRRHSTTSPLNRIALTATPINLVRVKMKVPSCYQPSSLSFLTGAAYYGTYRITANATLSGTAYRYMTTTYNLVNFKSLTGCTNGFMTYTIKDKDNNPRTSALGARAGVGDIITLTNKDSIGMPFGNRTSLGVYFLNADSPDDGNPKVKEQALDDMDLLYVSAGTIVLRLPSEALFPARASTVAVGFTPGTCSITVKANGDTQIWTSDKLKIAFSATNTIINPPKFSDGTTNPNYKPNLLTLKVPRYLAKHLCQNGLRFKYHPDMHNFNFPTYGSATSTQQRYRFNTVMRRAISDWQTYLQQYANPTGVSTPLQLNWVLDTVPMSLNLLTGLGVAEGYCIIRPKSGLGNAGQYFYIPGDV